MCAMLPAGEDSNRPQSSNPCLRDIESTFSKFVIQNSLRVADTKQSDRPQPRCRGQNVGPITAKPSKPAAAPRCMLLRFMLIPPSNLKNEHRPIPLLSKRERPPG